MRTLIIVLALMTILMGCAPDDQEFNIVSLSSYHQKIFQESMYRLNQEKPNASFTVSDDGVSMARYGIPEPEAAATVYDHVRYFEIVFLPNTQYWPKNALFSLTTHELCHILMIMDNDYDHNNGNPTPGNCLDQP